jgi:serine/threonine protein kinase
MQRLPKPKKGVIPSVPSAINMNHIHPNGKILSDEEVCRVTNELCRLANGSCRQIKSSTNVDYQVVKMEEKYYAYDPKKPIGQGGYGEVFIGQDLNSGEFVALKIQPRKDLARNVIIDAELKNLKKIKRLVATCELKQTASTSNCMVMELAPGKEFFDQGGTKITTIRRLQALIDAVDLIIALHEEAGLLHADIKCENMMINLISGIVTLIDYGVALEVEEKDRRGVMKGALVGTPFTQAPEIEQLRQYTPASDMFAFGITMADWLGLLSQDLKLVAPESPAFLTSKRVQNAGVRRKLHDLSAQATVNNPSSRPSFRQLKASLQEIADMQLDLLSKINNVGLIDVNEMLAARDAKDPDTRNAMITALCQFDEVAFVNLGNEVLELELMKLRRYLEDNNIPVGNRLFDQNNIQDVVNHIDDYECSTRPNAISLYFFVTPSATSAKNLPEKCRICPVIVDSRKAARDYESAIADRYNKITLDPAHIRFVVKNILQNIQDVRHKYGIYRNANRRCDLMDQCIIDIVMRKDTINYAELIRSLETLQRQMYTETWTFSRFFGIKTTTAKKISKIRENITEFEGRRPYDPGQR